MAAPSQRRLHVVVRGRVQGVFFRAWTQETAEALGLCGWVRNTADGAVEIVAQGPQARLEEMVQRCHRGPPAAQVAAVEVQWEEAEAAMTGFHVRH